MQIGFKYHNCPGFGRLYDYTYRHNHMITKEAKQRLKILRFWRQYGLDATKEAFEVKRSTLFGWWKIYKESGYGEESLNPKSQARKNVNKREIHPLMLKEI
jgi:transposase-like protein